MAENVNVSASGELTLPLLLQGDNKEVQRMDELYEILARHAHLYYDLDAPEISDFEYDALVRELLELELKYPELTHANSPTKRVGGAASSKFKKITHKLREIKFKYK